jgi:hypothetical protein
MSKIYFGLAILIVAISSQSGYAQDAGEPSAVELAKELANPIAALISVPIQFNYDENIGPVDEGTKTTINFQPVIPVSINKEWNLISRTILPVITQDNVRPGSSKQDGIGDIVQTLFFSPVAPTDSGWILGVGPVFLLPTGSSSEQLTADSWGLGPSAVALKQTGPLTFGSLINHIWTVDNRGNLPDVNATFLQPFVNYTTPNAVSFIANSESTYDWESEQWQVPLNFLVLKVSKIGKQLISWGGGVRYYAVSTDNGPEGWGARFQLTLLFPK